MRRCTKFVVAILLVGGIFLLSQGISARAQVEEDENLAALQILYDYTQNESVEEAIDSFGQLFGDNFTPEQEEDLSLVFEMFAAGEIDFGAAYQEIGNLFFPETNTDMMWMYDANNAPIGGFGLDAENNQLFGYDFTNGEAGSFEASVSDSADFRAAMEASPYWAQVFGGMGEDEKADTLEQLYEALVTGELGVGDEVEINGIKFVLVQEGNGSRLDAYKDGVHNPMRHITPELTEAMEDGKGKTIEEATAGKKNWSDNMQGDPAATGKVFYDEKEGSWKMEVEYWTNLDEANKEENITVDLNLDYFMDAEEKAEVLAELERCAESGEDMTVYGVSKGDVLSEGASLNLLGLGKGEFTEHKLPEEEMKEVEKKETPQSKITKLNKDEMLASPGHEVFYPCLQRK